jgi:hypothetical protein
MRNFVGASAAFLAFLATAGALAPAALAAPRAQCPSGGAPPPGSQVNGGLEVDGPCVLTNVTVNGGVVVDSNGALGFENSVANGGITVSSGGELDVNHDLTGPSPLGSGGTINGGIIMTNPVDFDIWSTGINGGIQLNGNSTGSAPTVCGDDINGGVTMSNATTAGIYVGDPQDPTPFGTSPCPGNTIRGGLTFSQVVNGAIEGNSIIGPVTLDASSVQFNGNTITGPSRCSNGTVIQPGEPPDPPSNTCS